MKWSDVSTRARDLTTAATAEGLQQLAEAQQFTALVALVLQHEEDAAAIVSNPKAAKDPGQLAHAAGALYEIRRLRDELQSLESR